MLSHSNRLVLAPIVPDPPTFEQMKEMLLFLHKIEHPDHDAEASKDHEHSNHVFDTANGVSILDSFKV
jgi:hypothetical protein